MNSVHVGTVTETPFVMLNIAIISLTGLPSLEHTICRCDSDMVLWWECVKLAMAAFGEQFHASRR
jgi:hypothetical protein